MDNVNSTFCKVYLNKPKNNKDSFYEGYCHIIDNEFVLEFKPNQLSDKDIIAESKILYAIVGTTEHTFYDIYKISSSYYKEYCIFRVSARKRIVGIFSENPNEENITKIEVAFSGIHYLFASDFLDHEIIEDKKIVNTKTKKIVVETDNFQLKISIWHPTTFSSSSVGITTETILEFNYKLSTKLFNALNDVDYFQTFIAFCSNNIHEYTIKEIISENKKFNLEYPIQINDISVNLFALSHRNTNNFAYIIQEIYKNKNFLQFIFKQFYKTSLQSKNKLLDIENFAQWVSIIEVVYDNFYTKIKNSDYNLTINSLNSIIKTSSELTTEQKTIAMTRLKGIIDNPLKEKIVRVLENANKYYYEINPTILSKDSEFISKIINTRNIGTHPNKKQKAIFTSLEIDKMNCLFKHIVFLNVCLNLGIKDFGDYYYEKIRYFFDMIDYKK